MQRWVFALLLGILTVGGSASQAAEGEKSLYDRLGGQPAIEAVASGLVDRILADNRVNKWFAHAASSSDNTNAYKTKLTTFICSAFGGPCLYTGPNMVTVHKGRGVTSDAFDAVAQDLAAQLDQLKVPDKEKHEVMELIGSLKPSIVQAHSPDR